MQSHHPVHFCRQPFVVGCHKRGASFLPDQLEEFGEHRVGGLLVEIAGGFVGQDQWRAIGEGAGDRHALLLAAGEFRRTMVEPLAQPERGQQRRRPLPRRSGFGTVDQLGQDDILACIEVGQEVMKLIDEAERVTAEVGPRIGVERGGFDTGNADRAFEPAFQQADRLKQSRLARSRRPHQGDDLPGQHVEIDAVEDVDGGVALREAAPQIGGLEDGLTHSAGPGPDRCWPPSTPGRVSRGTSARAR